jgi:transposase-like protein
VERAESHDVLANRVRDAVRQAVADGLAVAEIARRMGVSPASVYDFIAEGSVVRPYRRTLAQYERALSGVDESRENGSPGASEPARRVARHPDDVVAYPREQVAEWRGELRTVLRFLKPMLDTVQGVHDQLGEVTTSVAGAAAFLESGAPAVPPVGSALPPGMHWSTPPTREQLDEARRELEAAERQLAAQEASGEGKKRASGGDDAT